jgi:hypothetical protein
MSERALYIAKMIIERSGDVSDGAAIDLENKIAAALQMAIRRETLEWDELEEEKVFDA